MTFQLARIHHLESADLTFNLLYRKVEFNVMFKRCCASKRFTAHMAGVRSLFEMHCCYVIAKLGLVLIFDTAEITDEVLFPTRLVLCYVNVGILDKERLSHLCTVEM